MVAFTLKIVCIILRCFPATYFFIISCLSLFSQFFYDLPRQRRRRRRPHTNNSNSIALSIFGYSFSVCVLWCVIYIYKYNFWFERQERERERDEQDLIWAEEEKMLPQNPSVALSYHRERKLSTSPYSLTDLWTQGWTCFFGKDWMRHSLVVLQRLWNGCSALDKNLMTIDRAF